MTFDPLFIPYILGSSVILLILWIVRLEIKIKNLLIGKNAKSLEDSIVSAHINLDALNVFKKESIEYFKNLEMRIGRSIQAVETIRFNPFKGTGEGGNQSFSTAIIDEHGDGVILSSIYSRERISIFAKPIQKLQSTFELTDEEKEVLANAHKKLNS